MKLAIILILAISGAASAQVTFPGKSDRMFIASDKVFFSACETDSPNIPLATRDDVLELLAAVGMSLDSLQSLDSAGFHWLRDEDTEALQSFESLVAGTPYRETESTIARGWNLDEGSFLSWQWTQWDSSAMRFWPTQTLPVCSLHAIELESDPIVPEPSSFALSIISVIAVMMRPLDKSYRAVQS